LTASAGQSAWLPGWCAKSPGITDFGWIQAGQALGNGQCGAFSYPSSYLPNGQLQLVQFDRNIFPLTIPYDILQNNYVDNYFRNNSQTIDGVYQYTLTFPPIDTTCSSLNGVIPGCSITDPFNPNACQWTSALSGDSRVGFTETASWNSSAVQEPWINGFAPTCGGVNGDTCQVQASFCRKTRQDESYKKECCLHTLFSSTGSMSLWFSNSFWKYPTKTLSGLIDNVIPTITSFSVNPYQLYCDPYTCPGAATCDQIIAEECAYSTTYWTVQDGAVADGVYHAALVPGNACSIWYKSTYEAYPNSTHSFLAVSNLINNYCGNGLASSATAYGDSWSCFCLTFTTKSQQLFYTPCTDTAIGCSSDPNFQNSPLITVLPTVDGTEFIGVGNPICSNPICNIGRNELNTTFITPNLFQRSLLCPSQTCLLISQGFSISTGVIISQGGVEIVNKSLFCAQSYTAPLVPSLAFFPYNNTNIWFWDLTSQTILDPDVQGQLDIINSSTVDACVNIKYSNLKNGSKIYPWLGFTTVNTYSVIPFTDTASVFIPLNKNQPPTQSEIAYIDVTVTALQYLGGTCSDLSPPFAGTAPVYTQSVQLNVISVDPPVGPPPAKPDPGQNSTGIPIPTVDSMWTLGGLAILVLSITFIIFGIFLLINSNYNSRVANDAIRWVNYKRLN
jgi:hypothetical protein